MLRKAHIIGSQFTVHSSRIITLLSSGIWVLSSIVLLVYIIYIRYQLALIRYFDPDELAYLNWGAHIAAGQTPYLDFMLLVTPGFVWLTSLLFHFGSGLTPVIWGRILAFIVSLAWAGSLGLLFWLIRRHWLAILVPIIFLTLPLPGDKLIEIRPDNLAFSLFTVGLLFLVIWSKNARGRFLWFSGVSFGLSLLVLQKPAPQLFWAIGLTIIFIVKRRLPWVVGKLIITGFLLPLVAFGLWAIVTKHPNLVWYSVVNLPLESSVISKFNPGDLWFYFQPNSIYYGQWGRSLGWLVNHGIWILAIFVAVNRFISVFIPTTKHRFSEVLLSGSFVVALVLYIYSPLKHPQYLLPAMGFVALYAVDGVYLVFKKLGYLGNLGCLGILIISALLLQRVWLPKLVWTNAQTLEKMQALWRTIPAGEPVLDLEGRSLYYPYPYYVCCLSFGQFGPLLSRPLPPLIDSLKKTQTKYIYQAEINRIGALTPVDRDYILSHYTPTMNGELYVAK